MQRPAFASAVLLAAAFSAGCGSSGSPEQAPPPSIVTEFSPTASPEAPAPADTTSPMPQTSSAPPEGPSYPDTAEGYAKAVVARWVAKDLDGLAELTTAQVHEQLIEIPGPLDMDWAFQMCDGTAGSSYCHFRNDPGDVLILRISHGKLEAAHGAVEVRLEPIS